MILQLALAAALQQQTPPPPDKTYFFFVASQGSDEVALVRFGPKGLVVEHRTALQVIPGDVATPGDQFTERFAGLDADSLSGVHHNYALSSAHGVSPERLLTGPHQVTVAADGRSYFVTTARGFPSGELLKVQIAADTGYRVRHFDSLAIHTAGNRVDTTRIPVIDSVRIVQQHDTVQAQEPISGGAGVVQISSDGAYAWVTSAAPGDPARPSWVSVVYLRSMVEVAQIPTCAGARGGRFTADGSRHFSVCTGADALVEIDARTMKVARRLSLDDSSHRRCAPMAVAVVADGSRLFVSCSASDEILEIDARAWSIARRIAAPPRPGELAVTANGTALVVVGDGTGSVALIQLNASAGAASAATLGREMRFAYLPSSPPNAGVRRTDIFDASGMIAAMSVFASSFDGGGAAVEMATWHGGPAAVVISNDDRYAFVSAARAGGDPGSIDAIDLASGRVVASIDFGRQLAGLAFWKSEPVKPGN